MLTAEFELTEGRNHVPKPVLVLRPGSDTDAMLLELWMRYDANSFSVKVDRAGAAIVRVYVEASDAE